MKQKLQNALELREWFHSINNSRNYNRKKIMKIGIMVSTDIRKDVLLAEEQGRILLNGINYTINFENLKGGVWRAFVNVKMI